MTNMVARKIGTLMGQVMEVNQNTDDNCVGRFLRVRVQFNVGQPLMKGTFVAFPGEGSH